MIPAGVIDVITTPGLVLELLSDPDLDPEARRQLQAFEQARKAAQAQGVDAILITITDDAGVPCDVMVPV